MCKQTLHRLTTESIARLVVSEIVELEGLSSQFLFAIVEYVLD